MTKTERQQRRDDRVARFFELYVPPAKPEETTFRHAGWKDRREKVRAALARTHARPQILERFDACGSDARVEWSEEQKKHRIRANYCHHRHCQPCAKAKANNIARNLKSRIENNTRPTFRFITLTQKKSDQPLEQQIAKLYANFKKLRSTRLWKSTQIGGAFILEVKRNGDHWHAHLHVIAEGNFIRVHELSDQWLAVTGESFVVDVRIINSATGAAHYVTKYLAKSADAEVWNNDAAADEWITASKSVRSCATYGTWRGFRLNEITPDTGDWTPIGSLVTVIARSRAGDPSACAILKSLMSARPNADALQLVDPD